MATASEAAPPFYPLTQENHSALVVVTAVIFFIYSLLGIIGKLIIRLNITSMKDFDLVLLASTLLYFVQTCCVIAACNNGLGEHRDAVSDANFDRFSKLIYASRILALLVSASTKISLCLLIRQISNQGGLNLANLILGGVVIAWAITGIFATAFQCPLPQPWLAISNVHCPSQGPIYIYSGIMNILTDIALCVLPVAMMWEVQTSPKRKAIVMALFGTRLIVPIVTIPTLSNATYLFSSSDDVTWQAVSSMIWAQISLGLSVLTVCIPSLKGVIDSLMGSTAVAAIGAPYELKDSGNGTGLEMTAIADSSSRQTSKQPSGLRSALRLGSRARGNEHPTWRKDVAAQIETRTEVASGSDSVRKLTEGVLIHTDFNVQYDDESRADSRGSSEAGYHM
ncbi:hypothetical protein FALBO_12326 [Fusarium albosuccineum]|uniref:Rhodopsin domain-containing protein n=1 Tax=Fusarium albosuccineum TaxID=1237068 RepID=A0A8H4P6D5_9HYPO|nr:hypothetical protein FALBO_12326 [Fusarium albosuccineum]